MMNITKIQELKEGEVGERVNLENAFKWVLSELDYEDFKKLTHLKFYDTYRGNAFDYIYAVSRKDDSPKAREEYIKYFLYKLIQNLSTPGIELL